LLPYLKALRNNAFRTSILQGQKSYWGFLDFLTRLKFRISRIRFSIGEWRKTGRQSTSILWSLFKRAIWGVLGAILLVSVLSTVENHILPGQLSSPISNLVSTYGVLAQISGLILGLYFTAMSVVVSTIYSKVPDNIRNLIAREKVGDNYIDILMLLGATSLIELGAILQGQTPSIMVLYVALFLSLMALLTLPILIHNVFHFFDPARLAETYIFPEAFDWARKATCGYQGWDNPSFQYHYYKQANQRLSTYKNIVDLLVNDPTPNNASLTRLMAIEFSFLSQYVMIKGQIPTESRWYQYQTEHPKWFETHSSSVEMAMHTNTSLPHKETPNHLWVEERVAKNLKTVLSHLLNNHDLEHAIELIQHLQASCTRMVKSLALKEAYFLTGVCDELILEYLSKITINDEDKTYQLALADFYGANHVNIPIEYGKILEEVSPDSLRQKLRSINWENPASAYKAHLPVSILPSIEDILQRKQNQFIIDRSVSVPEWYDLELIAIACLKFLHETAEEVVSQYERAFTDKIEAIKGKDTTFLIMQILTRGIEGYSKCSTFLSMAENLDKGLHDLVIVKDIPHPTLEWSEYEKRVENVRSKVIEQFGSLALIINPEDIDKKIPDYAGHAYWLLARECFLALCEQDEERYKKVYRIYIYLMNQTWAHFSSILAKGQDVEYHMSAFSEIFVDAMAIGGYAKLFNEFREGNYWKITTDIWDDYLKISQREDNDLLNVFLSMMKYVSRPLAAMTNRHGERFGWERDYNRCFIEDMGLPDDDYIYRMRALDNPSRKTVPSPILRTFGTSNFYHAENVFIYSYILQKPGMENAEIDRRTEQFIKSLNITLRNDEHDDNT
jgi:hypothetical protein